jgi:hypothetical protein
MLWIAVARFSEQVERLGNAVSVKRRPVREQALGKERRR